MNKCIHQIWLQGRSSVPTRYLEAQAKWQRLNPDYSYVFWDHDSVDRLLEGSYPTFLEPWRNLDLPIKKCDAARCFILHCFGGVYADLDTTPYRPINELVTNLGLVNYDIVLSEENQEDLVWKAELGRQIARQHRLQTIVGNAIMLGKKDAHFWLKFLRRSFELKDQPVLESFSTWHLSKFLSQANHSEVAVIPSRHLLASKYSSSSTYATHAYHATWFNHSKERPWEG